MKTPDEASMEKVAERVRWLRDHLNLKQKDFASSIEILPTQLNNWEKGNQRLSLQGALKISKVYGVSLDFLFLGRADTLPQQMRVAWASRPRVSTSSASSENPDT
ncbi:helix-turn-helix transcriptional regulator [Cohaesibacter intestini]|uniref:helix-turn-helix transcriptional regulator n=1 Tax=Cohaesibacter intestini TaxID=2211145 RepID=UPI000DE9F824|nr:helix-turn-helix transcriptional regulator [Cohaesibacter intestini]